MARVTAYLKSHPETVVLAAIILVSTLLRLCFLHEPFDRDEGLYAAIGQSILRGELPYRDAVEIKPPASFYLYALAIALFGATVEGIRSFTACYAVLTVVAVYAVTLRLADRRAALLAAAVYGVFSTFPLLQGSSSNTEVFLVLPLLLGVWFLLRFAANGRRRELAWCGLCGALAMLIKPVALPFVALGTCLVPLLRPAGEEAVERLRDLASYLAPMAVGAILVIGYFKLRGGLDEFLYWTVVFPRRYRASSIVGPSLPQALHYLSMSLYLPFLVGSISAAWLPVSRRSLTGTLPLMLLLAGATAVALPGKFFPHYFIVLIPFLAVSCGIGLARLSRLPRVPALLAGIVLALLLVPTAVQTTQFYTDFSPEEVSIQKFNTTLFADSVKVASYLKQKTRPDDYIYQWGFEPELYFLADRRSPSPLFASIGPSWAPDPRKATAELRQRLTATRPAYIVVQEEFANYPGDEEVSRYVNENCDKAATIEYAQIFRCR